MPYSFGREGGKSSDRCNALAVKCNNNGAKFLTLNTSSLVRVSGQVGEPGAAGIIS
jgi:hypothetical protein